MSIRQVNPKLAKDDIDFLLHFLYCKSCLLFSFHGSEGPDTPLNKGIKVTSSVSVLPVSSGEHRMRSIIHKGQRVLYMHTIRKCV